MFFQWVMCSAIFCCGLVLQLVLVALHSSTDCVPGEGGCHVPRQGTALYHDQEQTIHGRTCPANGTGSQACCGVPCGECARPSLTLHTFRDTTGMHANVDVSVRLLCSFLQISLITATAQ